MKYLVNFLCFSIFGILATSVRNASNKDTNNIDYYPNYEYELTNNFTEGNIKIDSLILPNPESFDHKYSVDVLPNVELPSDSLVDTDLKDHDFIDNLMYIYYGSHSKNVTSLGSEIIIVGSVLSCAAQLLTIFCTLVRKNKFGKREINKVFLHMIGSLCFANLVFMLGVYSTKSYVKCQIIALLLHYLHLLTPFWIFLYCYYICNKFNSDHIPQMRYFCLLAYGVPLILVLLCYAVSPQSYETKLFCFVSVQKGMLLNYMLPVSILIVSTTVLSLNGIRKINLQLSKLELTSSESLNALRPDDISENERRMDSSNVVVDEEVVCLREFKQTLKTLSLIQTSFDVVWFISVLALENGFFSNVMPVLYLIASCSLNWYIFWKYRSFVPNIHCYFGKELEETNKNASDKSNSSNLLQSASRCGSSDNIPLLNNAECYTELRELRHDTISTISS